MARKKSNNLINAFKIFFSSIHTYFLYLDQTSKALLFPIFGQIISIALIFTLTGLFNTNIDTIQSSCAFFEDDKNLFITFFIILIPLFLIMAKSIYDYLIAFASLNILFYTNSNKKAVKNIDFKSNNNVIQRKLFQYIVLMFIVTILFSIPPLIFISPIIGIFLSLTFQVFALEGDVSAFRAVSRSIELVKSNIIPTIILLLLCIITTYIYLPGLFIWACEKSSIYYFLMNNCENFLNLFDLNNILPNQENLGFLNEPIQEFLSPVALARTVTEGTISFIIVGFTLPFRCCCFTELYKLYDSEKIKENSKSTDEIIKRATGKKGKN